MTPTFPDPKGRTDFWARRGRENSEGEGGGCDIRLAGVPPLRAPDALASAAALTRRNVCGVRVTGNRPYAAQASANYRQLSLASTRIALSLEGGVWSGRMKSVVTELRTLVEDFRPK
jgi:hypothetical protein